MPRRRGIHIRNTQRQIVAAQSESTDIKISNWEVIHIPIHSVAELRHFNLMPGESKRPSLGRASLRVAGVAAIFGGRKRQLGCRRRMRAKYTLVISRRVPRRSSRVVGGVRRGECAG